MKASQSVNGGILCAGCERPFQPSRRNQKHCRPGCRMRAYIRRKLVLAELVCEGCGVRFQPRRDGQKFCRFSCEPLWGERIDDTHTSVYSEG